jgi:hypothetical protein
MKTKSINKKLFLNKTTIVDLNDSLMGHLKGAMKLPAQQCRRTADNSTCPTGLTCPSDCSGVHCC